MRIFSCVTVPAFSLILSAFAVNLVFAAGQEIALPAPNLDGTVSVEKALHTRRSIRSYAVAPLSLADAGQMLWAAQGITDPKSGKRTAPSARAQYFLTVYLSAKQVTGLQEGLYQYAPERHALVKVGGPEKVKDFIKAGGQAPLQQAPAALLITGKAGRSEWMHLEAGHAAQNVYLQAVSLNLGTVVMAGFGADALKSILKLPKDEQPIYLMPIGAIAKGK